MEIFLYNNRIQGHFRLKKSKQTRVRTRRKGVAFWKVQNIVNILKAEILAEGDLQEEVKTACGSDMMSDVLAFVKDQSVLLTGLVNPQVVRTAEMMDMHCIIFVRGRSHGKRTSPSSQRRTECSRRAASYTKTD